ncbi:MAG TPA: phage terminase large subunit family protein [Fervidobacterium sp.]|nr:phage terminase large subunit family protein [Fervidobacterium sp.]
MSDISVRDFLEELAHERPSVFAQYYRRLKGKRLRYTNPHDLYAWRHFLVQPMDDFHSDKVIKKARQLGASECHLNEVFWFLTEHDYTNTIYTFPRGPKMREFSQTRVEPAIQESPYLDSLSPVRLRNVTRKPFNHSNLFLNSAWGKELGEGTPADMLCLDEYDQMADGIEGAFIESLSSSPYKLIRRFSTPTLPGRGVSELFDTSDQHFYFYTCEHCGEKQYLTKDNLIQIKKDGVKEHLGLVEDGTFIIGCTKCKKELNRVQKGEWVAAYPGRAIRGYHMSQLNAPWITADEIMRSRFKLRSDQLWYNYVLGEPYYDAGALLSPVEFQRCENPLRSMSLSRENCTMVSVGIDWGKVSWVTVLGMLPDGKVRLLNFFWETDTNVALESVNRIAARIQMFEPDIIICDTGYGQDRIPHLMDLFPGRVWGCQYSERGLIAKFNHQGFVVSANRTGSLKQVILAFKKGGVELPRHDEAMETLMNHLCALTILQEEDDRGEFKEVVERMGPDHGAHSFNYANLGIEKEKMLYRVIGESDFSFLDTGGGLSLPQDRQFKDMNELAQHWLGQINSLPDEGDDIDGFTVV